MVIGFAPFNDSDRPLGTNPQTVLVTACYSKTILDVTRGGILPSFLNTRRREIKLLGWRNFEMSKIARSKMLINQLELLVPIRLEIDHDHFRLRDTFTWNLNDPVITPEVFAQCLCDDYQISSNSVVQAVAKREDVRGKMSEAKEEWWPKWRSREDVDEPEAELEEKDKETNEELPVLVKVDVIVGTMDLTDQFEWDINDAHNSPEEFAEVYCKELGLGGEFKTADELLSQIKTTLEQNNNTLTEEDQHLQTLSQKSMNRKAIREQVSVYQKSLFLVGHPFDGTPIADDELKMAMLPPIDHSFRFDHAPLEQLTPQLDVLQETEIERNERERERKLKRKRRQTRGLRGIVLPPGLAKDASNGDRQPAPVTYRRAAAAAASLTIANLAATENGTSPVQTPMHIPERPPVMMHHQQQQQQQQVPPPQPPKQKRQRTGILQPPPLPNHVFISRSADSAPSTALDSDAAARARADFGGGEPEGPASPTGEEEARQAMLWQLLNSGCPESISVGRRKEPLGQGTMCGECGELL
ncbi:unnamed protein product [Rhizoctonia solani]|uniref:SNF5-domain-containing protein n=1 Tax=Rhizoctonia solani TaxID=456999 RepID=A0A8H3DUE6_9AGAM|nr:unnamed protein product [Rhizoctonia solani]